MRKPKEKLLERERHELNAKSVGGILSYEVWGYCVNGETVVTRYNLAHINHAIHAGDTCRWLWTGAGFRQCARISSSPLFGAG